VTAPVPTPQDAAVTLTVMAAVASDSNGAPITPSNVPHSGAAANPTAAVLAARFGDAVIRSEVIWGETTVFVTREALHAVIRFLHDDPGERYDYLVDVTAVEYRDGARPIEVVWHLRALGHRRFLRLKVELPKRGPLWVPSVIDIYSGADWLERECFDMFGIRFEGHPDLRRLLLWEQYKEGYPLRKDFPLTGHVEVRYDSEQQRVVYQPVTLQQDFRSFDFLSPWEGMTTLPGDEKVHLNRLEGPA